LGIAALPDATVECCGIERLGTAEETTHLSAVEKFNMIQHGLLLSCWSIPFITCEAVRLSL
jgi:hypothetical protein